MSEVWLYAKGWEKATLSTVQMPHAWSYIPSSGTKGICTEDTDLLQGYAEGLLEPLYAGLM